LIRTILIKIPAKPTGGGWNPRINNNEKDCLLNDEIVFSALGFEHLDVMDYSAYEFANIIHDLNDTNVPEELLGKYDFILEGGTLEHVFNFRNALEVIFKMLKIGGTFFFDSPIAYGFNHGYYTFSPCLYYEYFSANNWEINTLMPYGCMMDDLYHTIDPANNDIYSRYIPLLEKGYYLIWGSVTKTSKTTFDVIPYQVSYSKIWESSPNVLIYDAFKLADSALYIYGTGKFACDMLKMLPNKYRNKIVGLLSNASDEIGQMLYGYKVMRLENVTDSGSVILIATSEQYQSIIPGTVLLLFL